MSTEKKPKICVLGDHQSVVSVSLNRYSAGSELTTAFLYYEDNIGDEPLLILQSFSESLVDYAKRLNKIQEADVIFIVS